MHGPVQLDPRVTPVQARAQQRIDDILNATQALLERNEDVTTSAIAVEADIPVGSVYRYFPNILSIFRSLFEKINGELREQIVDVLDNADSSKSWDDLLSEILASSVVVYQRRPAYGRLLMAMAMPALLDVRQGCIDMTSEVLAERWRAGKDGFHGGDIDHVAQTASKLFTFVEQCYFEQLADSQQTMVFYETVKALRAYLSLYLKA